VVHAEDACTDQRVIK